MAVNRFFITTLAGGLLDAVSNGQGDVSVRNPALSFVKCLEEGGYEGIDPETKDRMLENIRYASETLWELQPAATCRSLLNRLLLQCSFKPSEKALAATTIARAVGNGRSKGAACFYDEQERLPEFGFPLLDACTGGGEVPGSAKGTAPAAQASSETAQILAAPKRICDYLSTRIFAQEDAKRAAAMLLWNHLRGRNRNLLFAGPTGCGKTAIWEALRALWPDIVLVDGSRITQEGWKGSYKTSSMLEVLPRERAGNAIYVIDEADKLFESKTTSNGENQSYLIQSEFLKLLEGGSITLKDGSTVSTKHASFVFLGSFETMLEKKRLEGAGSIGFGQMVQARREVSYKETITQEDLVRYGGVRREIAGRIGTIVQLSPMDAAAYRHILETPSMSPIHEIEEEYHVSLRIPEKELEPLCESASKSRMGVRYLKSRIQDALDREMFDRPDAEEYELSPEE